uniref:Anaphase-promoting complex subunit 4 WD40 domain-containing protein n=1 Tax=Lotharella globosa TaxID=91324 RepID=A0A6V3N9E5_9EUKA|mmetsp:Transcript_35148/g.67973  ORF Transcript_35148/g.67973 Transcript_35148/m.67973 type:complete len:611 (+) Transcript_35148:527-2359(+)
MRLEVSLTNVMSSALRSVPLPSLLAFNLNRLEARERQTEIRMLKAKIEALQYRLDACGAPEPPSSTSNMTVTINPSVRADAKAISQRAPPASPAKPAGTGSGQEGGEDSKTRPSNRAETKLPFLTLSSMELEGHTARIECARFSGDGKHLATGGADGVLRVWKISDELLSSCPVSTRSTTYDRESQINLQFRHVDAATANSVERVGSEFFRAAVGAVEWDPVSEELLLCGMHNSKIRLWSARQRRVLRTTVVSRDPAGRVVALACSPKRPVFVAAVNSGPSDGSGSTPDDGSSGKLVAINLQTGRHVQNFTLGSSGTQAAQVASAYFNHNGNMLLSGGSDGMVRIFEMQSNRPIMAWPAIAAQAGGRRQLSCVRFSAGETTVLTAGSDDGFIHEWSLHKLGKPLRTYRVPPAANSPRGPRWFELALDSEGHHFLVTSGAPSFRGATPPPFDLSAAKEQSSSDNAFSLYRRQLKQGPQDPPPPSPGPAPTGRPPSAPPASAESKGIGRGASKSVAGTRGAAGPSLSQGREKKLAATISRSPSPGVAHLFSANREIPVQQIEHKGALSVTSVDWHPSLDVVLTGGDDGKTLLTTLMLLEDRGTRHARAGLPP